MLSYSQQQLRIRFEDSVIAGQQANLIFKKMKKRTGISFINFAQSNDLSNLFIKIFFIFAFSLPLVPLSLFVALSTLDWKAASCSEKKKLVSLYKTKIIELFSLQKDLFLDSNLTVSRVEFFHLFLFLVKFSLSLLFSYTFV